MLALDVNVVVSALLRDAADHEEISDWLEQAVNAVEPVGVSDAVLGAAVRILTNPRIHLRPTPLEEALTSVTELRDHDGTTTLAPGRRHWEIFSTLCREARAQGNLVADAQHAALAIEAGATWISKDGDFARFPGLRWRRPLD